MITDGFGVAEINRGNKKDSFKVSIFSERKTSKTLADTEKEGFIEVQCCLDTLKFGGWQHITLTMISRALETWV